YKACLWSRLANHILLPITSFKADDQDELYEKIQNINWLDYMRAESSFKIDANGSHSSITNTVFIIHKVKDGIVDQIRAQTQKRPDIQSHQPDTVINIYVNRNEFSVSLSLSGESLHKRGYRLEAGIAPLRETLAAAILMRSGWLKEARENPTACLIDPMCGSGTLLIEGALMAYDIAPGLDREYFGFYGWCGHNEKIWSEIEEEAEAIKEKSLADKNYTIIGTDLSTKMVDITHQNIHRSGLTDVIQVKQCNAQEISYHNLSIPSDQTGIIVCNPPYGERLNSGQADELALFFKQFGKNLKDHFKGWELSIITSAPMMMKSLTIRSFKRYQLYNGALEATLLKFKIDDEYFMRFESPEEKSARLLQKFIEHQSESSQMFENRLRKNLKHLKRWAKREEISCYRIYDADLPEYAVAIDLYENHVHIQEYQAGKNIDAHKAETRLQEAYYITHKVLEIPLEQIHLKVRKRQKGVQQYNKISDNQNDIIVKEGAAKFYVNFESYLDTGLFLDHRIMRKMVAESSKGKSLLNLFAYTCTASILAALNQAKQVTSVDMSNTYLDWGKRNFSLNKINLDKHQFIQADCLKWLERNNEKFDVIFLDPPTFSNSKRMEETLDIQRDHAKLIQLTMNSLNRKGVLYFSNNYRRFKLDQEVINQYQCDDISNKCLPEDFKRRPNIHHCWVIKFK
ncbi:bifunctional 23S rRNA (guanine(2069)-N(7))-methyltransferase RlmK/23S rRNA (guanine(2445)-N(2))-methyltransferase RlmL, partial [Francisellaceae bacterium]|nr:bifunctional 23S rRNA (guanine(2069)-N(7))-methyltransferase RlmK/23S rRNA (guanine(2445)-N(2))-methyltransferase RlmL [Francisellaceae bacterium]